MLDVTNQENQELENSGTVQPQASENTNTSSTDQELEKVVNSIEVIVAEAAEKVEEVQIPTVDVSKLSLETIVKEITKLVKNEPIQAIKTNVEALRKEFDFQFGKLLAAKKAAFLAEGGESIDFKFSSPVKIDFNAVMADYRGKRDAHYKALDTQLKENLDKRLATIDALKLLIENADSKTMYKDFKQLQEKWNAIGPVPRTKYNNTWRNYHHHVERFYDLLHMNNDLRDLDFKHNLEEKLKLVAKANELAQLEDVNKAFKELQALHKAWKEDIGPVAREHREEVWQKFSEATKLIHDKRDKEYEVQKSQYEENVQKKLDVIKSLEAFDYDSNASHSDWQKAIVEFEKRREVYFTIGKVPRNKSQKLWEQLKAITKRFNHAKNKFYKDQNSVQQVNLDKKLALLELAKSLKDSDDFKNVTGQMKKIQADWKKIGHVPRKHSDKIWKEFKDACNHYFDRVHDLQDNGSQEEKESLATKQDFLSQIKGVLGNDQITLDEVKAYIDTWRKIGRVPRSAKQIETDFNEIIKELFVQLGVKGEALENMLYKLKLEHFKAINNSRKLESELTFVRKKVDDIVKNIKQLENNLSFISNASDDNPLVLNVKKSIAANQEELIQWKNKLKLF